MVGYFLQGWSTLETTLNRAIEDALKLDSLQGVIVTKNIQVRDKLNILKTLVDLHGREVERYKKALTDIGNLSQDRNMVAHDMFLADDQGDGVQFVVVKAKGKLTFPATRWSVAEFIKKYMEIGRLTQETEEMRKELSRVTLASLLRKGFGSTSTSHALVSLDSLIHPPQAPLHSSPTPANPGKPNETPPEPDQK